MAEPNEYGLQREERIRRNKAMLAKLQVCLRLCSHTVCLDTRSQRYPQHRHCLACAFAGALRCSLQVQQKADDVAAPLLAALQQKEAAKEAVRQKYVASGPARQSKRAGAERTRAKLQQQAEDSADSSSNEQSISSDAEDSDSANQPAARSKANRASRKRKHSAQEADFDPTGDAVSVSGTVHLNVTLTT